MDINTVLANLKDNDLIITPNRRLAHVLLQQHEALQIISGLTCWKTPQIIPVNVWIDLLWRQYSDKSFKKLPHILNPAQEQLVWETILREFDDQEYFLQIVETARMVKSARGLLKQWCVSSNHPLFTSADDYAALAKWIEQFESVCKQQNWLDAASLPALMTTEIKAGNINIPSRIFHAGFNELSPELNALLSACPEVHALTLSRRNESIVRTSANDSDAEIRLMANWAHSLHLDTPNLQIGCVLPLLDKQRDRVVQIFTEVFGDPAAFNISAGQPLSSYPVINAALTLLTLYKKQLSAETLFYILATPFIGHAESERISRCQFDSRLRSKNFSTVNIDDQITQDNDQAVSITKQCPRLAHHIRQFKAILKEAPEEAPFSYWAQCFNQLLTALGWPGERIINSEEYQVVSEWLKLLQSLTTLDITAKPVRFYEALRVLAQEAATKPFQPQSPAANVQILGILEAAGLVFDALWISGLDDSNWPAQPKPNPFIPKRLQRELKMPHASAERELEYCEAMTRQFSESAHQVIFSYARTHDETSMQPSPLIRGITELPADTLIKQSSLPKSELIYQSKILEEMIDVVAPAMQADEVAIGGVEIIKNQALCPFKAFAESRLRARELENPLPGLRSRERGTIVHYILEKCWDSIKTSEALLQMSDSELDQLLDEIIVQALHEHARAQAHQRSYLKLEKNRLKKLIRDWLDLEKTRPPFSVLASETISEIKLNDLILNVRIDRIDQLENGKQLIIDYKTSSALSVSNWLSDRPDEPQLPLYAQRDSINTAGITFAQVTAGDHCFKGISQMPLEIKGIKAAEEIRAAENKKWDELTNNWQQTLTRLADDFYQGKANVDPKEKSTCQYCGLKPLCRVHQEEGEADVA